MDDAKIKTIVITNTPTIETQLVHLWCDVQRILKHYNEEDRRAEMASFESYYVIIELKRNWAEHYTYEF